MSLQEFINKSNKIHNNKFDYSLTKQFKSQRDKVKIICPEHGEIEVNVGNHLGGSGCKFCSGNAKRDTKSFLQELKTKKFLFEEYDYSLVDYKNTNSKVIVIVPFILRFKIFISYNLTSTFKIKIFTIPTYFSS